MTWRERIQAARERGHFTIDDVHRAGSWTTCAVGEQADRYGAALIWFLPETMRLAAMDLGFGPSDVQLRTLGGVITQGFGWAVATHQIDEAERLLDAIEDRALHLKREHGEAA